MRARPNPWLTRRVLAYAHQGGAREGPSSTRYAIERALESGADAIELDVHATRDGHLVVGHDPTVDRTTDGTGPIAALSLAELSRLDHAFHFVPGHGALPGRPAADYPLRGRFREDRRLGATTLEEVLEAFPGVPLNLDVKQTAPQVPAYEHRLVELLRSHGRNEDVIVAAFDRRSTDAVAALAPEIGISTSRRATIAFALSVRLGRRPPAWLSRYVALQVPPQGYGLRVDAAFVEAAHEAGLAVHVWTIDEPTEMERLVGLGVDGIMTDVPSVLAGVLTDRDAAWGGGRSA